MPKRGKRPKGFVDSLHDPGVDDTVNSVSGADTTVTITPTIGDVLVKINLANANTWASLQTFSAGINVNSKTITDFEGTNLTVAAGVLNAAASLVTDVNSTDGSLTINPTVGNIIAEINHSNANTWLALQTFSSGINVNSTTITNFAGTTLDITGGVLNLNLSNPNIWTTDLTMAGDLLVSGTTRDIGSSTQGFRTLWLDSAFIIRCPTADGSGSQTSYGIDGGGGAAVSATSEGGEFEITMDQIATSATGSINEFIVQLGGVVAQPNLVKFVNAVDTLKFTFGTSLAIAYSSSSSKDFTIDNSSGGNIDLNNSGGGNTNINSSSGTIQINSAKLNTDLLVHADSSAFVTGLFSCEAGTWGGLGSIQFGGRLTASSAATIQIAPEARTTAAGVDGAHLRFFNAFGKTTIPAGVTNKYGSVQISEPNITATGDLVNSFDLKILQSATEANSNYSLWVWDNRPSKHFVDDDVTLSNEQINTTAHGLADEDQVTLNNTGGALPVPLAAATLYYVTRVDANNYTLSLTTPGGTAVNITSKSGGGVHFVKVKSYGAALPCISRFDGDIEHNGSNLGFYLDGIRVPVAQESTAGLTTGFTAGSGTAANDDSTHTGNDGSTAYTVSDIVRSLKAYGLLAK